MPAAAPAPERPNFLIAVADDWSYGHAGVYGCSWVKTPAFDRVAKEGVLFTHAYTPNAKCAPSRSCILTGRNPWQLRAAANHYCFFPAEFKTFPEALSGHGYNVGMTGKGWGPGVATNSAGARRQMTGEEYQARKATPPAKGIAGTDYSANFKEFLQKTTTGRPWCFWYGGYEPHRRYEYGSGVAKAGKQLSDVDRVPAYWPDNEIVRNDLLDYAFEVEHFDQHLARMLGMLESAGKFSNTVVIVTSDNGMPFPRIKSQSYQDSNHLPLAIMWPAGIRSPGRVVDDYVSFIDFAPTVLDLAGLNPEQTGMVPMTGHTLKPVLLSTKHGRIERWRDHVLIGKERHDVGRPNDWGYPVRGLIRNEMLLLQNFEPSRWPSGNPGTGYLGCDGSPTKTAILNAHRREPNDSWWQACFGLRPALEFYDLKKDPDCLVNLAGERKTRTLQDSFQKQLVKELKQQEDPRMFGKGNVFESYSYSDAAFRNFYARYLSGEKLVPGWVNPSDFETNRVTSRVMTHK